MDMCLEICNKYSAFEAVAYLYEKEGNVKQSLLMHMKVFCFWILLNFIVVHNEVGVICKKG